MPRDIEELDNAVQKNVKMFNCYIRGFEDKLDLKKINEELTSKGVIFIN